MIEGMRRGPWGVCGSIAVSGLYHVGGGSVGDQRCIKGATLDLQVAWQPGSHNDGKMAKLYVIGHDCSSFGEIMELRMSGYRQSQNLCQVGEPTLLS